MATPTAREIWAGGGDALGRRLDDRFGSCASESGLLLGDGGFDFFARQNEGKESRLAGSALVSGKVGETIATVNHLFDGKKQAVILTDGCERPSRRRA